MFHTDDQTKYLYQTLLKVNNKSFVDIALIKIAEETEMPTQC